MFFSCLLPQHSFRIDQRQILTFEFYYLKNRYLKAKIATEIYPSDRSGESKLKTFWKGFTIPDAINIMVYGKRPKYQHLTGAGKSWL